MNAEETCKRLFRLGIDARALDPGFKEHFGRGTGRYAEGLFAAFRRRQESGWQPVICGSEHLVPKGWKKQLLSVAPRGRATLETQFILPATIGGLGLDGMHFLAHCDAPSRLPVPYVITVLDLIPLKFPELYAARRVNWRYRFARFLEQRAIAGAQGILTISECSRRDIVDLLGIPADKVAVTLLGVDQAFCSSGSPACTAEQNETIQSLGFDPSRRYLAYAGGIDARKNVGFLVRVLKALRERRQDDVQLLLVGRIQQDEQYPALKREIDTLGLNEVVHELGFVSDEMLRKIYRAVDAFVFPSLYEGFGLPVLESLACGTWVVAGRNSSLREVAGDCASLLPDNNLDVWVRELDAWLDASEELRLERRAEAMAHARQFHWDRTAEATADAYRQFFGITAAVREA